MPPASNRVWLALTAAALVLISAGWWELRFVCDDAFIAFRYARNILQGWGPTWNPPPFAPVEGYTSALWVGLLTFVWALGAPPVFAAEALSLICGLGTGLVAVAWLRRALPHGGITRTWLAGVALLGIVTNRAFLTWTSSGLETSLFNLLVVSWMCLATHERVRGGRLGFIAALLALTRPDGLLYCAATVVLLAARRPPRTALLGCSPLVLVVTHLVWRRVTYGVWLPNTYYAKVSEPWPEAGVRYIASFMLENGLWLGVPLLATGLFVAARKARPTSATLIRIGIPAAALLAHVGYYVLRVGGDHFEFRVLSHMVVPTFIALAWAAAQIAPKRAPVWLLAIVGASWPVAWTHHALGRSLETRAQTEALFIPVAPHLPPPFSWVAEVNDELQEWLIQRYIGRRHREHAVFRTHLEQTLAQPDELIRLQWDRNRPIAAARSVGVVGWRFHEAAILDELGLNDPIIARGPLRHGDGSTRRMAHDRRAPDGYLECFRQNLTRDADGIAVDTSVAPMSDADIEACQDAADTTHHP